MSTLTQVLVGTSARPRVDFYTDLDVNPTYVITRPDGTTLASGTASKVTGETGIYEVALSAQPAVTLLTITWTGDLGGEEQTATTQVEMLGALLFTLPELRGYIMPGSAATPFEDPVKYPAAKLQRARAATLARFSTALGYSPVPRHAREVHSVGSGDTVVLERLYATRILSVTVAGVAQTASNYFIAKGGVLQPVSGYSASGWSSSGFGVVAVEYEHGAQGVDDDGRDAALAYAAHKLNPSTFTSGTNYTTPDGVSITYEPGAKWATGIREVDRWIILQRQSNEPAVA